jgi:calcineurin-like phosphoesterase family protein
MLVGSPRNSVKTPVINRIIAFISGIVNKKSSKLAAVSSDLEINQPLLTTFPYMPMVALRLTLLNDHRKIMYEYDLMQKRLMTRDQALDRREWEKTLRIFRLKTGMELQERVSHEDKKIFLISDLHLDHKNIIGYCGRPFYDINIMNKVLVNNWNMTVNNTDTVYFLGDLSYGRGSRPKDYWLEKLCGDIHFISGNHERDLAGTNTYEILKYNGYEFLLVHDPKDIPIEWNGWIIHGHKHNTSLWEYPFINGLKKTINVSAEVIKYKPLDLDYLLSLDIDSIKRMDLVSSIPLR